MGKYGFWYENCIGFVSDSINDDLNVNAFNSNDFGSTFNISGINNLFGIIIFIALVHLDGITLNCGIINVPNPKYLQEYNLYK